MAQPNEIEYWFTNHNAELLETSTDKKSILVELKSGISNLDNNGRNHLARSVDLNNCFSLLSSDEEEVSESGCDVIYMLLNSLPGIEALIRYNALIPRALAVNNAHVKRSFLKLLAQHLNAETLVMLSSQQPEIICCVIECIASQERSVAECAIHLFKTIGKSVQGVQVLFSTNLLKILKETMKLNDIVRFRIYEIIVDMSVSTLDGLSAAHSSDILPSLLIELKDEDPLILLNVLELLTNLTANQNGLLYLQREGVIAYLVDKIKKINEEPLSMILLPGLIEFFGNMYKLQPIIFSQQHPEVLMVLFDSFNSLDPALLGAVISTLAMIGSSDDGRRILIQEGDKLMRILSKLGSIITRKDNLCVTAMNTLAIIFQSKDDSLSRELESCFIALGSSAMDSIVGSAKLPFVEVRISAFQLLASIALHSWGISKMCLYPSLLEFFLDRNAEFDKQCIDAKYELVKLVTLHPSTQSAVSTEMNLKLKKFVNEGPYFVPTELEIAFEPST